MSIIMRYNEEKNQWAMMALSQFICYEYHLGLRHWEILEFLKTEDGINIWYINTGLASQMIRTSLFRHKARPV